MYRWSLFDRQLTPYILHISWHQKQISKYTRSSAFTIIRGIKYFKQKGKRIIMIPTFRLITICNIEKPKTKEVIKHELLTILRHKSSIFSESPWYLFACFLIKDDALEGSFLPIFSRFNKSCSSNLSLEETPAESPSTFQGDSLLVKKKIV